jgi:hypothetical protein
MKKLLWSIALIAALSFVFIACGPDEEGEEEFSFTGIGGNYFFTGETITANGTGLVHTYWMREDADDDAEPLSTAKTFTPTEVGKYTLIVAGENTDVDFDYRDFLVGAGELKGTWYLNAATTVNRSTANPSNVIDFNETLTITKEGYVVVETQADGTSPYGYTFTITDWEKVTRQSLNPSVPGTYTHFNSAFPGAPRYTNVFKVTGEFSGKSGDYNSPTANAFIGTSFHILFDSNNGVDTFVRTYASTSGDYKENSIFPRLFEREKKGTW